MGIDRNMIARQIAASKGNRPQGKFHRFRVGKNVIRIFSFAHTANRFDIPRGLIDTEDDVGVPIVTFTCPVVCYFDGRVVRNCLTQNDPYRERYWAATNEERKQMPRMNEYFYVNAVDLTDDESESKGVQEVRLSAAMFRGPVAFNKARTKLGYGVMDFWQGYTPDGSVQASDEDAEGSTTAANLGPVSAYGDALFGPNGRDFIVYCVGSKWNGKDGVMADKDRQGGCLLLRQADKCKRLDPRLQEKVIDLYMTERMFPGWSADGKFADPMVADWVRWSRTGESHPGSGTQSKVPPAATKAPSKPKPKAPQPGEASEDEEQEEAALPPTPKQESPPPKRPSAPANVIDAEETQEPPDEGETQIATTPETAAPLQPEPANGEQPQGTPSWEKGTKVTVLDPDSGLEFNGIFDTVLPDGQARVIFFAGEQSADASKTFLEQQMAANREAVTADGAMPFDVALDTVRLRRRGGRPKGAKNKAKA